jgi:hypothetical protein
VEYPGAFSLWQYESSYFIVAKINTERAHRGTEVDILKHYYKWIFQKKQ